VKRGEEGFSSLGPLCVESFSLVVEVASSSSEMRMVDGEALVVGGEERRRLRGRGCRWDCGLLLILSLVGSSVGAAISSSTASTSFSPPKSPSSSISSPLFNLYPSGRLSLPTSGDVPTSAGTSSMLLLLLRENFGVGANCDEEGLGANCLRSEEGGLAGRGATKRWGEGV